MVLRRRVELPTPAYSSTRTTDELPWPTSSTSMIPKNLQPCYDGAHRLSYS